MTTTARPVQDRIESFPTERIGGYGVRPGRVLPFGATLVPSGVNFSVYSSCAQAVTLVLFKNSATAPFAELPFPEEFRIGAVWSMTVFDLEIEDLEYGYRVYGPDVPDAGDRFDPTQVLADPYAKAVSGRSVWGVEPDWTDPYPYRSRLTFDDFDWDGDQPLRLRAEDLVIYEAHVRGFTNDPSSAVAHPGTYAGLVEKIPYLKDLGVNCIELMPVFEFDETGEALLNYWGYSTVSFFAPKAGFAATGRYALQRDEFKHMVKELHAAGIEVVLDVVFNHTAEGNQDGPMIHFRGLDNRVYYLLTGAGDYYNFSGTGNTVNCNSPVVRDYVLSCLRFWAAEYHVDGFRFDLAAILSRGPDGAPMENPPLIESLAYDPVLQDCLLIAEAWDAGGLYQVGSFPNYRRWSEWNGKYRDTARRFLKGDPGMVGDLAKRVIGSPDLYHGRGTHSSINFLTCHDGFTLADMVSYNDKHNEANGEGNRDGANDNNSWNGGVEGPTADPEVLSLRNRQLKNAMVLLLTSQGVPMILSGDEVGRSQHGNNNAYCHDSGLSWFDWSLVNQNSELLRFVRNCIGFRLATPLLRTRHHPRGGDVNGYPDVSWHGSRAWDADWSEESRLLAVLRSGELADGEAGFLYIALNAHWAANLLELPNLPADLRWHVFANTSVAAPDDVATPGLEPVLPDQHWITIGPRAALVLVGRRLTS